MSEPNVKIRVKVGVNEVEIEAPLASLRQAIELLPEVIQRIPGTAGRAETSSTLAPLVSTDAGRGGAAEGVPPFVPQIKIERDDSLMNVITKLFADSWGKRPRKLADVREVLDSYGMVYPKQSVAVALLRLAQTGKLRRFKDQTGEFIYTASTVLAPERTEAIQQAEDVVLPPANL